jgi:hypothetical protein
MNKGNAIVEEIEGFKQLNGRLPNSLSELGIQQDDLFYNKWDSVNYMVWFGTDLGESKLITLTHKNGRIYKEASGSFSVAKH